MEELEQTGFSRKDDDDFCSNEDMLDNTVDHSDDLTSQTGITPTKNPEEIALDILEDLREYIDNNCLNMLTSDKCVTEMISLII